MADFSFPTQFKVKEIKIEDTDITAAFMNLEIFENIFIAGVSGSITFMDVDGNGFVEEEEIEFNEPFKFTIESSNGDTLKFDGVLNGLQGESTKGEKKVYTADFCTEELRTNEKTFVSEKYDATPEEVVSKMIEKVEGTLNSSGAAGEKMQFLASRWHPLKVVNYVLQRGTTDQSKASAKEDGKPTEEKAEGTSGFLCWQTIGDENEYRMCTVDELLEGAFETHTDFENKLMNKGLSLEEANKAIIDYDFQQMGDIQTNLRSGAFHSKVVSFDMDTGEYKEYTYDGRKGKTMTEKQKKIADKPTRILMKPFQNDKFAADCEKAEADTGDQSRKALAQGNARQNTFNDQTGTLTCYARFDFHAGDIIDIKINKVKAPESSGGNNQKHSGKYVIKQVGHHFTPDNRAYTKIKTIRASNQTDKSKANQ